MCGKKFSIYGVHTPQTCNECIIFTHALLPHLTIQVEIFENLFPPKTDRVEEAMTCFIKIQSENMKMTWNVSLFTFCMICNFSKCDGFTVL